VHRERFDNFCIYNRFLQVSMIFIWIQGKVCRHEGRHKGRFTSRHINRYVNGSTDTKTEANECECSGKGNHVIEELRGKEARARYLGEAVT